MKATSIGHAGMLIETADVSIVCDPWFLPAFHGSWCVFPRNDRLSNELMDRIESADYLYISHIHGDHLDEPWLANHINRTATILLPDFPTHELENRLRDLGFVHFVRTTNGREIDLLGSTRAAIHCEISITDGPGGDSALVVADSSGRIVNQNDCRTHDTAALASHGPIDLHWLQYSGAIWYPMVYDEPADVMGELIDAKVDSQFTRALRYVETLNARAVVPSAGPPAFLDPDLFGLNVITGEELSIFPDQTAFMERLSDCGHTGILAIPGTCIEVAPDRIDVTHPCSSADLRSIFEDKESYLREYQADWLPFIEDQKASWSDPTTDLVEVLSAWWEPLLAIAPTLRQRVGTVCLLDLGDLKIAIDFPNGTVSEWDGSAVGFRFTIDRRLVETVAAQRAVDWSNSLFLSCRFSAWREGPFNEYVYNFFKSLSEERMQRTEAEALRKTDPDRGGIAEEDIRIGDWIVQRTCPHRGADLEVFGQIEGNELVCTLHGWRFDCQTGTCITAEERTLRIRPATDAS
ncbi:MAG: Rieske 2Fe-2S domain-containing protein [Actinomycetes bacterium]